jgi:hypothetical protein
LSLVFVIKFTYQFNFKFQRDAEFFHDSFLRQADQLQVFLRAELPSFTMKFACKPLIRA